MLLFLAIYFIVSIASYQRKRNKLTRENICSSMHLLEKRFSRMALDLHDDIGNSLAGIRLKLELSGCNNVAEDIGQIINRNKQICNTLLPEILEKEGLGKALHTLAAGRTLNIVIDCHSNIEGKDRQLQAFRIVQELYSNTSNMPQQKTPVSRWKIKGRK